MKSPAGTPAPQVAAIFPGSLSASSNLPFLPYSRLDQPRAPFLLPSVGLRLAPPHPSFDFCSAVWSFASARSSPALLPARRSRTHTSIPVFPCRKKKFPCLEVSAQDSVARQLLIPRAPHPVRRQSSYINRFCCHTRNRRTDDATSIVILRPAPLRPVGGRISRAFPPPPRPEPRTRFRGPATAVAPSCHKML